MKCVSLFYFRDMGKGLSIPAERTPKVGDT